MRAIRKPSSNPKWRTPDSLAPVTSKSGACHPDAERGMFEEDD
jgi:hypothetical protein